MLMLIIMMMDIELRDVSRGSYWRRVATVGPTTTTYMLRDLSPGSEYVVRILAKNEEGEGSPLSSEYITMPKSKSNLTFRNTHFVFVLYIGILCDSVWQVTLRISAMDFS